MPMAKARTSRIPWVLAVVLAVAPGCGRDPGRSVHGTDPAEILTANPLGIHSVLSAVQSVVFSPDGKTLATGGQDCRVTLWDTSTWRARQTLRLTDAINGAAFSPDGRLLATGHFGGSAMVWVLPRADSVGR
jgi:WD40 repeat protein